MFILIPLIILAIGLAFVPNHIHGFGTTKVKIPAWIIIAILIGSTFFMIVDPGEVVRVYQFGGGERTLTQGWNMVMPWDRKVTWDATAKSFAFVEVDDRDNPDPNNAFGGQTADGDYMTTVANITVRINTERMSDYIATFGTRNVNDPENNVDTILKGILKEAFEQCLANWPTEKVMANKPTISAEACAIAIARIETEHPLIVSNLNYPDIQASDEYEAAIKQIADARMLEQLAKARKTQNEAEAEANNAKAIGEATVIKTNADAAKYQQEIAAEATANATRTAAQAEADALLLLANAEAEASGKLGTLYAEYPGLLEVKRLEAYQAIGANWNGQYIPSIGGGDSGLNILNIGDILGTLLRPQESATPVATVEAPPAAE